jgi:hypothetical protein
MRESNSTLVTNTVMNANIISPAVELVNIYGFAVQAVYTGTPTGTLKLQASNDAFKDVNAGIRQVPVNWTDIADSSFPITSSGVYIWNFNGCFYSFVRLVYTDASGGTSTAVLNANIQIKGV